MNFKDIKKWEIGGKEVKTLTIDGTIYWQKEEKPTAFYIENADTKNISFTLFQPNQAPHINLEYSNDNGMNWQVWKNCQSTRLNIPINGRVYLRGTNNTFCNVVSNTPKANKFECDGKVNIGGDLTTLLEPNGNVLDLRKKGVYTFYALFQKLILQNVKDLKLTSLYLTTYCYSEMFWDRGFDEAPHLVAKTIGVSSYDYMFYACKNLKKIEVDAESWNTNESTSWVEGVPSGGTFIKPNGTNIPFGENGIPSGWTVINK